MPQSELPSGTVTLLFTDIEGSTRRWEALPEAMATALATHDDLLRFAIEANGGHVFKTVGDAFCAAFADPDQALAACLVAQRSLAATDWGEVGHVRVRMALHTGEPEHRENDYFGPPVNRVARLLSTGFGGQVLVSAATAEQLAPHLPAEVTLADLGAHRLKDLLQPERVYQVTAPGLDAEFPPLKSLDRQPHNLPAQPTPLVGREAEVAAARALLADGARLVTLTGPGGTGKTRLGLQVAAELLDGFPDGAWFAGLAPLTEAGLVVGAIAAALGVREAGHEPLEATLLDYLRHKRLLLVLDNFEHVLAAAPLVGRLLAECTGVQVLATSRAALRVYGEREVAVPPLRLPDPRRLPPLDELAAVAAVELFVERAQAVKPGFALSEANARPVAEVVVKLEGLPLAIELAAARARILAPDQILARLSSRLALLTGGAADRDERQRTLRGAIAWSHDLLTAPERTLFRRLAAFASGTFEAIEAVCVADGAVDALDGLESLVQKSLLRQEDLDDGPRFFMLETIREFAAEQLEASGEAEATRGRHAAWFLGFGEAAEPHLTGPEQAAWLDRLEAEHDNFRAALRWFGERAGDEDLRLAGSLWRFWDVRGHLSEGRGHLEDALARRPDAAPEVRVTVLNGAGVLAHVQGDLQRADALHEAEMRLGLELGDQRVAVRASYNLGLIAAERSQYELARNHYERARDLSRQIGYVRGEAVALEGLFNVARYQEDLERAERYAQQSLAVYRDLGDQRAICCGLQNLGILAFLRRDYDEAARLNQEVIDAARQIGDRYTEAYALVTLARSRRHVDGRVNATLIRESLATFQELGDKAGTAHALYHLGLFELLDGNLENGRRHIAESLNIQEDIGDRLGIAHCLEGTAIVAFTATDIETGAMLFGAAQALRGELGAPLQGGDRDELEEHLARAQAAIGEATVADAVAMGAVMTVTQAVREAQATLSPVDSRTA